MLILKCTWNIFTFSWVIIKYFNTFSFCICNSIAFCHVFCIQIHLRIFILISGYSKISINCRVASITTKKLIWCDSSDVCMRNLPPTTFVTTLMRHELRYCGVKSNRAGSRFWQWLRAKFWRQHWSPHSRHESMHELHAVCHPLKGIGYPKLSNFSFLLFMLKMKLYVCRNLCENFRQIGQKMKKL